jgi:ligand-binding sensor domain-containing protein
MLLRLFLFFNLLTTVLLSQNYVLKQYSVAEGLPQSQVYDIIEDHNGQIWLATRGGGLARFNGRDFKVFSTDDGLVNNFISSLYQDERKNIWIGTSNGVSQYNGIQFRNYLLEGNNFSVTVSSITESKDTLYLGTSNGLYKRVDKKFVNVTNDFGLPGFSVTDVFFDKHDVM